jgi:flagellar assembly factor FliW
MPVILLVPVGLPLAGRRQSDMGMCKSLSRKPVHKRKRVSHNSGTKSRGIALWPFTLGEYRLNRYQTLHFGLVEYLPEQVIIFPAGLPAFEDERQFIPIEQPASSPVIFLQSLSRPDLVFITLPMTVVHPAYEVMLALEDRTLLELPPESQPPFGEDILCLAIVTVREGQPPTANLMAPVVISRGKQLAVQVIQSGTPYSHQHALAAPVEERCS